MTKLGRKAKEMMVQQGQGRSQRAQLLFDAFSGYKVPEKGGLVFHFIDDENNPSSIIYGMDERPEIRPNHVTFNLDKQWGPIYFLEADKALEEYDKHVNFGDDARKDILQLEICYTTYQEEVERGQRSSGKFERLGLDSVRMLDKVEHAMDKIEEFIKENRGKGKGRSEMVWSGTAFYLLENTNLGHILKKKHSKFLGLSPEPITDDTLVITEKIPDIDLNFAQILKFTEAGNRLREKESMGESFRYKLHTDEEEEDSNLYVDIRPHFRDRSATITVGKNFEERKDAYIAMLSFAVAATKLWGLPNWTIKKEEEE